MLTQKFKIDNNLIAFIVLLLLTISVFFLDSLLAPHNKLRSLIIYFSNLKFLLVYFIFMGVSTAHSLWKILGLFLVVIQVLLTFVFV